MEKFSFDKRTLDLTQGILGYLFRSNTQYVLKLIKLLKSMTHHDQVEVFEILNGSHKYEWQNAIDCEYNALVEEISWEWYFYTG
ncbi:hypothetical protein CDAR_584751 [Caerostris darwini]|uniref:Uncharacterized protein n=1 Tax=Caerostris darwini TaxID=1538125 RepID=A0AAV4QQE8_9ARAC|nr:hypothetical protein CDAR_584751 [Caerostris darwini]